MARIEIIETITHIFEIPDETPSKVPIERRAHALAEDLTRGADGPRPRSYDFFNGEIGIIYNGFRVGRILDK